MATALHVIFFNSHDPISEKLPSSVKYRPLKIDRKEHLGFFNDGLIMTNASRFNAPFRGENAPSLNSHAEKIMVTGQRVMQKQVQHAARLLIIGRILPRAHFPRRETRPTTLFTPQSTLSARQKRATVNCGPQEVLSNLVAAESSLSRTPP